MSNILEEMENQKKSPLEKRFAPYHFVAYETIDLVLEIIDKNIKQCASVRLNSEDADVVLACDISLAVATSIRSEVLALRGKEE